MRLVSWFGVIAAGWILAGECMALPVHFPHRKHPAKTATLIVQAAKPGCRVDVDGASAGVTNAQGRVTISDVEPSAHYLHIKCGSDPTRVLFVSSLQAGQRLELHAAEAPAPASPLEAAENRIQVRTLLNDAVNLRSQGRFPQAIQALRTALALQPENPNLHHELGTTFLMFGQWENARIELIETVRYDPNDADAHNALGFADEKLGDIKDAVVQYRDAMQLDPQDDSYHRHYLEALALLPEPRQGSKGRKR